MKFFTYTKLIFYDFYLFTLVTLSYAIIGSLFLLKYFVPAKKYKGILIRFTYFIAQNFSAPQKSYTAKQGIKSIL